MCPARPQQPTNAASTSPLKCIDSPAEDDAPLAIATYDVLRFVSTAIPNAVPDQRDPAFTWDADQSTTPHAHTLQPPVHHTSMDNTFNIGSVNVSCFRTKRPLVEILLRTDNIGVLAITDTHCNSINVAGYQSHARPKDPDGHGGTAILIRRSVPSTSHPLPAEFDPLNVIAATIHTRMGPVRVISVYVRPRDAFLRTFFHHACQLTATLVLGDFNARHVDFGDHDSNHRGNDMVDALDSLPIIRIHQTSPTFLSHVQIQHRSRPGYRRYSEIFGSAIIGTSVTSDHLPVIQSDWELFHSHINNNITHPNTPLNSPDAVDEAVDAITNVVCTASIEAIPTINIKIERRPLPTEIIKLIREKRNLYRHYVRTGDANSKCHWNRLNALIRRLAVKHREDSWIKTCSDLDPTKGPLFWRKFKCLTGQYSEKENHLIDNNNIITTPEDKADTFASLLENVHQVPQDPNFDDIHFHATEFLAADHIRFLNTIPAPQDDLVTEELITETIASKKGKSAPGEDRITYMVLKHLPASAITLLTLILNDCYSIGHHPAKWKSSIIIMIPKPNKPVTDPSSYHPISLLNTLGKIYEKILATKLSDFFETTNVIPPHQYGFRQDRSTQNAILRLTTSVTKTLNYGHFVSATFLDLERAFDPHSPTSSKNEQQKSESTKPCPTHSTFTLEFPKDPSSPHICPSSSALISRIQKTLTYSNKSTPTTRMLQHHLTSLESWMPRWRIKPNPNKTQLKQFRHRYKRTTRTYPITLWNTAVQPVREATYLGVKFAHTLYRRPDIKQCSSAMRKRSALITRLRIHLHGCSEHVHMLTYKMFVRPLADYRAICYASARNHLLTQILKLERRFLRKFKGLNWNHPSHESTHAADVSRAKSGKPATVVGRIESGSPENYITSQIWLFTIGGQSIVLATMRHATDGGYSGVSDHTVARSAALSGAAERPSNPGSCAHGGTKPSGHQRGTKPPRHPKSTHPTDQTASSEPAYPSKMPNQNARTKRPANMADYCGRYTHDTFDDDQYDDRDTDPTFELMAQLI
ncbi:hypothetical protein CBL_05163 [Carabus blaptoides fortunei]